MSTTCVVPISVGELIDKITILSIKVKHCQGARLNHVIQELAALEQVYASNDLAIEANLIEQLQLVNQMLWNVEDSLRKHEQLQDFGQEFVRLARSVYQLNDRRAAIKYQINVQNKSALIEEKVYGDADAPIPVGTAS